MPTRNWQGIAMYISQDIGEPTGAITASNKFSHADTQSALLMETDNVTAPTATTCKHNANVPFAGRVVR